MNFKIRAQSAMEYLMTYGWAILVVAVILATLYQIGVFNTSSLVGSSCIASSDYYCTDPVLTPNGNLAFNIGQQTGENIYQVNLACGAYATINGLPENSISWMYLANNGLALSETGVQSYGENVLGRPLFGSQTFNVTGLTCIGENGLPLGTASSPAMIGTAFSGFIWINFTTNDQGSGWETTKISVLRLQVQ